LGSANISAALGVKTFSFKVTVIDSKDIKPVSITINSGAINTVSGINTTLQAAAYDMYGNSFSLDNSIVKYQADKNIGTISNGIFTSAGINSEQSGYITASYLDCVTKVLVKVTKPKSYVTITSKTLNVRETASATGKVVGTLKQGEKVEVISESGGWMKINYNGKQYYIAKQYTKAV
jgi:uncharacterized protein YgiM (DUF1202 family)